VLELDEALARFHLCSEQYGEGFANHGPMAAEALCRLGHPALMTGLVDVYAPRLPARGEGAPIPEGERAAARGDRARTDDWRATFEAEISLDGWRAVLRGALPKLIDGAFAAATHGLLRTAHAVRALEEEPSAIREAELARGLAVWAGAYQELPGEPGREAEPGFGPAAVLAGVEPLREGRATALLSDAARALDEMPSFAEVIQRFDPDAMPFEAAISELCQAAAGLYLEHPHDRVAYAHGVTASSALRLLAAYLEPDVRTRALGRVVQTAAAVHALSACDGGEPRVVSGAAWGQVVEEGEVERMAESPAEIRYRAACSLEVHAIKLAEACLREDAICPNERLRAAAADAAIRLDEGNRGRVT